MLQSTAEFGAGQRRHSPADPDRKRLSRANFPQALMQYRPIWPFGFQRDLTIFAGGWPAINPPELCAFQQLITLRVDGPEEVRPRTAGLQF